MTRQELINKISEFIKNIDTEEEMFTVFGLRFENKVRKVGEIITENSRHNPDREDERDFPEFESVEYDELPELDGVSTWLILDCHGREGTWKDSFYSRWQDLNGKLTITDHCYIVSSDDRGWHDDPDLNEQLLRKPVVRSIMF